MSTFSDNDEEEETEEGMYDGNDDQIEPEDFYNQQTEQIKNESRLNVNNNTNNNNNINSSFNSSNGDFTRALYRKHCRLEDIDAKELDGIDKETALVRANDHLIKRTNGEYNALDENGRVDANKLCKLLSKYYAVHLDELGRDILTINELPPEIKKVIVNLIPEIVAKKVEVRNDFEKAGETEEIKQQLGSDATVIEPVVNVNMYMDILANLSLVNREFSEMTKEAKSIPSKVAADAMCILAVAALYDIPFAGFTLLQRDRLRRNAKEAKHKTLLRVRRFYSFPSTQGIVPKGQTEKPEVNLANEPDYTKDPDAIWAEVTMCNRLLKFIRKKSNNKNLSELFSKNLNKNKTNMKGSGYDRTTFPYTWHPDNDSYLGREPNIVWIGDPKQVAKLAHRTFNDPAMLQGSDQTTWDTAWLLFQDRSEDDIDFNASVIRNGNIKYELGKLLKPQNYGLPQNSSPLAHMEKGDMLNGTKNARFVRLSELLTLLFSVIDEYLPSVVGNHPLTPNVLSLVMHPWMGELATSYVVEDGKQLRNVQFRSVEAHGWVHLMYWKALEATADVYRSAGAVLWRSAITDLRPNEKFPYKNGWINNRIGRERHRTTETYRDIHKVNHVRDQYRFEEGHSRVITVMDHILPLYTQGSWTLFSPKSPVRKRGVLILVDKSYRIITNNEPPPYKSLDQ